MNSYELRKARFLQSINQPRLTVERVARPEAPKVAAVFYEVTVKDDASERVVAWNIPDAEEAAIVARRVQRRMDRQPTHDGDGKPEFILAPQCAVRKQREAVL